MVFEVAKVLIKNRADGRYLILRRANHPRFGNDIDLPGGTVEPGETAVAAVTREVKEEISVTLAPDTLRHLYHGDEYSLHSTVYNLYATELLGAPTITLSWEHSSYVWLTRKELLAGCHGAADTYMQMVGDVVKANLE